MKPDDPRHIQRPGPPGLQRLDQFSTYAPRLQTEAPEDVLVAGPIELEQVRTDEVALHEVLALAAIAEQRIAERPLALDRHALDAAAELGPAERVRHPVLHGARPAGSVSAMVGSGRHAAGCGGWNV